MTERILLWQLSWTSCREDSWVPWNSSCP